MLSIRCGLRDVVRIEKATNWKAYRRGGKLDLEALHSSLAGSSMIEWSEHDKREAKGKIGR